MDAVFKTEKAVFNFRVAGVWIENNHVLLHRDVNNELWSLPGGRVVVGEKTEESVVREFFEELGVQVTIGRLLWINENFFDYQNIDFHEIGFYYMVSNDNSKSYFQTDPFYGTEGERLVYKWIPLEKINNLLLVPDFLKDGLRELPKFLQHIVCKE